MRSTSFVILSVLLHLACVLAIAITPTRLIGDLSLENIELKMGTPPTEKVGVEEAQETPPAAKSKAKKVVPVPVAAPTYDEAALNGEIKKETPDDKLVPVKETAPDGVEASKEEDPAPVAAAAPVEQPANEATSMQEQPTGELAKGGDSIEQAVDYHELKQIPGNKAPIYPATARLEQRQGDLELVYRVTKDGKVADVQVSKSSGFKDLDSEAVRAISKYRYVPGQEGWAEHPVSFALKGTAAALPSQLRGKGAQATAD